MEISGRKAGRSKDRQEAQTVQSVISLLGVAPSAVG
jgi:hypothetical protein